MKPCGHPTTVPECRVCFWAESDCDTGRKYRRQWRETKRGDRIPSDKPRVAKGVPL